MSEIHTDPDLAVELFMLDPQEDDAHQAPPPGGGRGRGEVMAGISTGLVQLHRRYYGKGPTKAKTHLVDETVVCFLEGGFTTVERTLIDAGNADAVHQIRRSFQQAMEGHFTSVVESALGRQVIAYLSLVHQSPDLAVEVFVLEPGAQPATGEGQRGPSAEQSGV
jgi:uncharacterized protein YbcI